MANIKILLVVNTEEINQNNIEKCCTFIDNTSYMAVNPPNEYITMVEAGQLIEWSGVAMNPNTCDVVSINSLVCEQSKSGKFDLFGVPVLISKNGEITASIIAEGRKGDEETYTLNFSVIKNNDGSVENYPIDPKLGVNS